MLVPHTTHKFEKDLKKVLRQGKDPRKIRWVMEQIILQQPLPEKYRDHMLRGNYQDRRECHIEPDWLLIYRLGNEEVLFERTGSHSELFN